MGKKHEFKQQYWPIVVLGGLIQLFAVCVKF